MNDRFPRWALLLLVTTAACASAQRPRAAGAYRFQCDPPDAHVYIDEEDQGPCVLWSTRAIGVTAGVHRFRIVREGWIPQESEATPVGGTVTVTAHLRRIPD